jgi:succinate dehydrogenase / fumarate reductase membrane anchor subunit
MVGRTPLGEVRGLGSARRGTGEFIVQRVTSVALLALTLFFLILIVMLNGEPYATVIATLSAWPVAVALAAAILLTIVHMRIGMQVIIEDYVHSELKFLLLIGNWLFAWGVGLTAIFALLKIAFGG